MAPKMLDVWIKTLHTGSNMNLLKSIDRTLRRAEKMDSSSRDVDVLWSCEHVSQVSQLRRLEFTTGGLLLASGRWFWLDMQDPAHPLQANQSELYGAWFLFCADFSDVLPVISWLFFPQQFSDASLLPYYPWGTISDFYRPISPLVPTQRQWKLKIKVLRTLQILEKFYFFTGYSGHKSASLYRK